MVSFNVPDRCGRDDVPQRHNGIVFSYKGGSICGEMGATGGHSIIGNEPYSERCISYIFILVCECWNLHRYIESHVHVEHGNGSEARATKGRSGEGGGGDA